MGVEFGAGACRRPGVPGLQSRTPSGMVQHPGRTGEFPRREWEADVRIIEGGHAVIFGSGKVRLTEVLAGPETILPESGPALPFADPLGTIEDASIRRSRRISDLLRGRAGRRRSLPPSLRGDDRRRTPTASLPASARRTGSRPRPSATSTWTSAPGGSRSSPSTPSPTSPRSSAPNRSTSSSPARPGPARRPRRRSSNHRLPRRRNRNLGRAASEDVSDTRGSVGRQPPRRMSDKNPRAS